MIKKVFIDSDIILDVATGRTPFVESSRHILANIENGRMIGCISAHSVMNIYYILRKIGSDIKARAFLREVLKYLAILPVSHAMILEALGLDFSDFEDAVQHQCAVSNQCACIITRNGSDFKSSTLDVYSPAEFLALLGK
ncbi:MAG TPA: PIN domain-containing protein [Rectinemataceae bacterium]